MYLPAFCFTLRLPPTIVGISLILISDTVCAKNNCRCFSIRKILANRLKQCRKEKELTQSQVAIYCNITEKAYQNYELMTREPKLEILLKIADLFDVSLDYLVGRTGERRRYPVAASVAPRN